LREQGTSRTAWVVGGAAGTGDGSGSTSSAPPAPGETGRRATAEEQPDSGDRDGSRHKWDRVQGTIDLTFWLTVSLCALALLSSWLGWV
jgi:hypothetical protein